jgi:endonuclease/exonuclease/phosphatase family metal-dependent hydrolase
MFFLQAVMLQNQGWISESANLPGPSAFLVIMSGNMVAALGAIWAFGNPQSFHPALGIIAGGIFMAAVHPWISNPLLVLVLLVLSQFMWGWSLALMATVSTTVERDGLLHTSWSSVGGLTLFLSFAFLYYASLEVDLPAPRAVFPAAAAAAFGLVSIFASLRARSTNLIMRANNYMAIPVLFLCVLPLLQLLGQTLVLPPSLAPTQDIKVMTYNIHSAYDPSGRQNPEAIAKLIEASGAQIIGLQEVSRGWLVNGSTDLAAWFANRLGMQMLFDGTAGPMWGNALLTRLPIIEHGTTPLPGEGALIDRGVLWARLTVPEGEPLKVMVTHLHHVPSEKEIRLRQIAALLQSWDQHPRTILMGDLNAGPGTEEIHQLARAGLQDAWEMGGEGPGPTYPSTDPQRRIDWIWFSPEFEVVDAKVLQSDASDHLPLIVEAQW